MNERDVAKVRADVRAELDAIEAERTPQCEASATDRLPTEGDDLTAIPETRSTDINDERLGPPPSRPMAVARDHQSAKGPGPIVLDRLGHRGGRLSRADHHGAAPGRGGKMRRNASLRQGARDGRVKERAQQRLGHRRFLFGPPGHESRVV